MMRLSIKLLFCAFMFILAGFISVGAQTNSVNHDSVFADRTAIRQQGTDALKTEQARSKANLCEGDKVLKGGNKDISACLGEEWKTTEQNYLHYIHSINALLQSPEFKTAEDTWSAYRDKSCKSMATQWQGSQVPIAFANCRLTLTWNHMNELSDLYSDLWH